MSGDLRDAAEKLNAVLLGDYGGRLPQAAHVAVAEVAALLDALTESLAVTYRSPGGKSLTVCCCDRTTARLLICPVHPALNPDQWLRDRADVFEATFARPEDATLDGDR